MSVPPDARLAMPSSSKKFFLVKKNFLSPDRAQRVLKAAYDGIRIIPELISMNSKVKKTFGVKIANWSDCSFTRVCWNTGKSEELTCFNSYLEDGDKMPKWKWTRDRQVSAILWLSDNSDFLEFPYLITPPDDIEPKILKPEVGTLVIFPSHPMYAFQRLPVEKVEYLEYHATVQGAKRPYTSSQ